MGPDEKQGLLGFRSGLVIEMSVDGLSWWSIRDGLSGVPELSDDSQRWTDRATSAHPSLLYPSGPADLALIVKLDGMARPRLFAVLEWFLCFSLVRCSSCLRWSLPWLYDLQ